MSPSSFSIGWCAAPWRDPMGFNFPKTVTFRRLAALAHLRRHHSPRCPARRACSNRAGHRHGAHPQGFEVQVLGNAPRAGAFAGFSRKKMVMFSFLLSGGLAGLAGICEVMSTVGQLQPAISPGYGFTAIIVAFLGRLNPIGVLFAGLMLAILPRRRGCTGHARHLRQDRQGVPGHPAVLHPGL